MNSPPHYVLEDSNFDFRYVRLCALDFPREDYGWTTLQPPYNTVRYNTVLDVTRFKDGSQKCIDYIEKWTINDYNTVV